MNTPKPRHCGQNWLEMQPVEGGRMCGQCEKKITDFSKMRWSAIEAIQQQNNNTVCGMYHPKQLEHWGKEIPKADPMLRKASVIKNYVLTKKGASNLRRACKNRIVKINIKKETQK